MLIDREHLQEELLGTIGRLRDELDNMHKQLDDIAEVASAPLALVIVIALLTSLDLTCKILQERITKTI